MKNAYFFCFSATLLLSCHKDISLLSDDCTVVIGRGSEVVSITKSGVGYLTGGASYTVNIAFGSDTYFLDRTSITGKMPIMDGYKYSYSFPTNPSVVGLTDKTETREVYLSFHDGNHNDAFRTFYDNPLSDIPWKHYINGISTASEPFKWDGFEMSTEEIHKRIQYTKERGYKIVLYFADGLLSCPLNGPDYYDPSHLCKNHFCSTFLKQENNILPITVN